MVKVALKSLLAHKLRFGLTTLAVVLGVTFVAGSFVLTDSMEGAFDDLFGTIYDTADVYVRASEGFETSVTDVQAGSGATLDEALATEIADLPVVTDVVRTVEGTAAFLDDAGEPIVTQAPSLAFNWADAANPLTIRDGHEPRRPGETTMDAATFDRHGFALGDEVEVLTGIGVETFTLVGVTGFGEADDMLGATVATFELTDAQRVFDKVGQVDEFAVIGDGDVDPAALREEVAGLLRDLDVDAEVSTASDRTTEESAEVGEALGFLTTTLLAFAGIALFVGAFLIANTFAIIVAQRSREFALLRAVGASAGQVRAAVLVEASLVGVVASSIGLALGIGFAYGVPVVLEAVGVTLPSSGTVIAPRTIVAAYLVGVVITVVSSVLPARRASRVAPVEAMRGADTAPAAPLVRRTIAGAVLAVGGGLLITVGLAADIPQPLVVVGGGGAAVFLGVSLLAPVLAAPLARTLGALPARFSVAGRIARGNARRDPRRTASTASALMIGLALVSLVSILTASVQGAISDALDEQLRADFIIQQGGGALAAGGLPDRVVTELADDPAVAEMTPLTVVQAADASGEVLMLSAVDVSVIDELVDLGVEGSGLASLPPTGVALLDRVAEERGLELGDALELTFRDGSRSSYEVGALYTSSELIGTAYVLSLEGLAADRIAGTTFAVLASATDDVGDARAAVDTALASAPGATVRDQAEFRAQQEEQIDGILNVMLGLLALALVIALLGITNTLALAVIERTREIGLLRAVGMDRAQTRRMVLWESVIVAAFGALLGVAVGTALGWAVVQALAEEGVQRLVLPGGQLVTYVLVAVVAGVAAAVLPAWRASRLDVLEAVAVE